MSKAMNQRSEFAFTKEELRQASIVIQRTGSWLCALVDWAERRKCKFNAHHIQCMAQICSEIKRLGNDQRFIEEMNRMQQQQQEQVQNPVARQAVDLTDAIQNVLEKASNEPAPSV